VGQEYSENGKEIATNAFIFVTRHKKLPQRFKKIRVLYFNKDLGYYIDS